MLELTTRFAGITTAVRPNAARMTPQRAAAQSVAHLRYISRKSAAKTEDIITLNLADPAGSPVNSIQDARRAFVRAIENRAGKGGKKGIRVVEKLMCSLPNDFVGEPAREAVNLIANRLADGSSEVLIFAAIHSDRPGNLHAHFLAIDGLETHQKALSRTHHATKRVRRRSAIRLGERGRPKQLRKLFAECINEVAGKHGLSRVEARSFRDRGITKPPGRHQGPQQRGRIDRLLGSFFRMAPTVPIDELFPDTQAQNSEEHDAVEEVMTELLRLGKNTTKTGSRNRVAER